MAVTKGDWVVEHYTNPDDWAIKTADGRLVAQHVFPEANAYLMAAAPTMYLALKQIASCESHAPGDVVDIARKALSKAEGKSSVCYPGNYQFGCRDHMFTSSDSLSDATDALIGSPEGSKEGRGK